VDTIPTAAAGGQQQSVLVKIPAKTMSAPTAQGAWLQLQPDLSDKVKQLMEFAKKAQPVKISKNCGINELMKIISNPETDFRLRTIAAQAVVNLSQGEEDQAHNHTEIVRAGGLETMLLLLKEDTAEIVRKEAAIVAFENLTLSSLRIRKQLMALEPLPYIIPLLSMNAPLAVWCNAATVVVRNLGVDQESRVAIAEAGAIPPLIHVLNTGSQNGGRGLAAAALINVVSGCPGNKAAAVKAGALMELHRMMATGSKYFGLPSIAKMAIYNIKRDSLPEEVLQELEKGPALEGGRRDPETGDFVLDQWRTTLFKY